MTSKNSEKLGTVESKVPPMKVSVLIDNDVVEIIPDTRIKREFATPERCLNSEISELDAVVASLLPKKLQITANRAGKSVRGPPNRRVPPSDWEFHITDAASYLIVREENNPLFVREYISENKKVFQCCYCLRDENGAKSVCATATKNGEGKDENGAKSVCATATKNGEGKFVVIAALAQAHCKKCSLIPYEKCVKFRDTSETTKRCRPEGSRSSVLKANTKIKQNALKAAQLGSIKFILENLSAHKPTLESQEAGELEQSLPSTTSVPPAQVKVFKLQSNRYLQIPDSDWEYIPGSRGEPNGMILVKNSNNSNVREFRFLKATNNEAKKEYYCCKCLVLGRMIKIIIETSDMGKETAKMLKTKPHHFQCKGIPSGVYMKNKEQLAESAKM
uniref:Uncharacterized protein n=1 Tax=Panagrolaimus sp. JU765 TaxID=591449 RepID=A0AC34Q149_9BILA